jgi:hypothetical protein
MATARRKGWTDDSGRLDRVGRRPRYGQTAGSSAIWSPTGEVLARAGIVVGEVAKATLESR